MTTNPTPPPEQASPDALVREAEEGLCNFAYGPGAHMVRRLLTALADAPPTAVPAGWVMAPVVPTGAMLADVAMRCDLIGEMSTEEVWAAMIAAAPPPPSGEPPLSCADAMELARDMLHDEWLQTGDSETLAAHYVVADALAIFVSEPFTSPPSGAPSREKIASLIRERVRCDATGLSPAVASVLLTGFDDAADSILALFARGAG